MAKIDAPAPLEDAVAIVSAQLHGESDLLIELITDTPDPRGVITALTRLVQVFVESTTQLDPESRSIEAVWSEYLLMCRRVWEEGQRGP